MISRVSKLHGNGNDFLVTVALDGGPAPSAGVARALCDRHRGVGADGLITLLPGTDGSDARMELRNADGGIAQMSGNGVRCLAWIARREGLGNDGRIAIDTAGGRREVTFTGAEGGVESATVDMGPVTFEPAQIPLDAASAFDLDAEFHGVTYRGDAAGMGNPHLVLLVDDVETARVTQHGPRLEIDARFPERTNVEFVQAMGGDQLRMRVWERGVGETLSCGTGVCAAAAVAHRRGLVGDRAVVDVPGGRHTVAIGETIVLGGEVQHVFDVDVDVDAIVERSA